jgi:hypothetical protein
MPPVELKEHPDYPETVILLHGTFAAPEDGIVQWWQPGSDFCQELDKRLAALGSCARTWSHTSRLDMPVFSWTGRNSWADRYAAALLLAEYLTRLNEHGWVFHVVAHSHGGNVLLQALREMLEPHNLAIEKHNYGNLVCLGTPFIAPLGRRSINEARSPWALRGSLLVIAGLTIATWRSIVSALPRLGWWWLPIALVFVWRVTSLAIQFARFHLMGGSSPEWKRLLVMSSTRDEVFQLLGQALRLDDPFGRRLAPSDNERDGTTWPRALLDVIRQTDRIRFPRQDLAGTHQFGMRNERAVLGAVGALILGVLLHSWFPSGVQGALFQFLTLFGVLACVGSLVLMGGSATAVIALPARALNAARLFAGAVRGRLIAWWFRRWGWTALKRAALGTETYPADVQSTSLKPEFLKDAFYEFEELSATVEAQALTTREHDLAGAVAKLTERLTQPIATDELLRLLENSPALIHSAYYQYPECIAIIGEWIARSYEDLENRTAWTSWKRNQKARTPAAVSSSSPSLGVADG